MIQPINIQAHMHYNFCAERLHNLFCYSICTDVIHVVGRDTNPVLSVVVAYVRVPDI